MMRRLAVFAALSLVLAACEPATAPKSAPAPEPAAPAAAAGPPAYVGQWAVDRRICNNPAWRFEENAISTLGEVYCDFTSVRRTASGYAIDAMCTAEAPPEPYQITLTVDEPGEGMVVTGGPWGGEARLILCAPL